MLHYEPDPGVAPLQAYSGIFFMADIERRYTPEAANGYLRMFEKEMRDPRIDIRSRVLARAVIMGARDEAIKDPGFVGHILRVLDWGALMGFSLALRTSFEDLEQHEKDGQELYKSLKERDQFCFCVKGRVFPPAELD